MTRIKYIFYHPSLNPQKPRETNEAAATKVDYIISVLNRIGVGVDVISPAVVGTKGFCFSRGGLKVSGNNTFRQFPSFGCQSTKVLRLLSRFVTNFCFHLYLKKNVKSDETILVYHSLGYCSWLKEFKKARGFRLIGEIEEIYQDVHKQSKRLGKDEFDFFSVCDSYVFPNTVLNERINKGGKESIVIHGLYSVQPQIAQKFNDRKIHVLYAGTFDSVKGGALAAAAAAEFLPENYHVHITGFGTKADEQNVRERVNMVSKKSKAQITFHGFISRNELTRLMQQCHIGLCTQDPTKELNLTSFPSKILNYMSNGLLVLSGRNRAIEESAVGDIVYYYENQTPQDISQAIQVVDLTDCDKGYNRLIQLDTSFSEDLKHIL